MYDVFEIACYFYDLDKSICSKKLQKLCWYAYSWYIAINNEQNDAKYDKLFNDSPEAWAHGPVFNDLYADFKYKNKTSIKTANKIKEDCIIRFLDSVYDTYGNFTGDELESISHQELPWQNARQGLKPYERSNNVISDDDIFEEYLER